MGFSFKSTGGASWPKRPKSPEVDFATNRKLKHVSTFSEVKTKFDNRFQEFRVRRTCLTTGKLVEMPILMIKRHFLMAHQAFKNRTGNRKLIPYLTETEYQFLFEGISPKPSGGVVLPDLTPKRN